MAKKEETKFSIADLVLIGAILIVAIWYGWSAIHAAKLENEYVERWGRVSLQTYTIDHTKELGDDEEEPVDTSGAGIAWLHVQMKYAESIDDLANFDKCVIKKKSHLAFWGSYNYMKYVFTKDGKRYVAKRAITPSYGVDGEFYDVK